MKTVKVVPIQGAAKVNNHAGGGTETKLDGVGWSTGQCSK